MNPSEPISPAPRLDDPPRDAGRALGAGTRIGAFETQAVLAESASAIVYLACDRALETQVAVKEYLPLRLARRVGGQVAAAPEHAEAFRRGLRSFNAAARTLAHIDHPASARALLLWEANGTSYLAMPYYPGTRLLELRRDMRSAPDEAALRALLDGLLGALDAYHRRDSIHGGVSPSKILLLPDDSPLLLGAGSATRFPVDAWSGDANAFIAPEQAVPSPHAPLGPWTDLYALAAVVRFCISGTAPIGRRERFREPLAGRAAGAMPNYSAALLETLDAALSPDWSNRPQSAQQFRDWLGPASPVSVHGAVPAKRTAARPAADGRLPAARRQRQSATGVRCQRDRASPGGQAPVFGPRGPAFDRSSTAQRRMPANACRRSIRVAHAGVRCRRQDTTELRVERAGTVAAGAARPRSAARRSVVGRSTGASRARAEPALAPEPVRAARRPMMRLVSNGRPRPAARRGAGARSCLARCC